MAAIAPALQGAAARKKRGIVRALNRTGRNPDGDLQRRVESLSSGQRRPGPWGVQG